MKKQTLAAPASRLARIVVNLTLVTVMLVAGGLMIPGLLGLERYVIVGGSMSGTFERGSIAFEQVVDVEDLQVRDVITYQPPVESGLTSLVTHRIVSIKEKRDGARVYRTKGDANAGVDPWTFQLPEGQQPRVSFTVPYVGHAFMAIEDRHTRMLLLGAPAGVICLISLVELARLLRGLRRPAGQQLRVQEA